MTTEDTIKYLRGTVRAMRKEAARLAAEADVLRARAEQHDNAALTLDKELDLLEQRQAARVRNEETTAEAQREMRALVEVTRG